MKNVYAIVFVCFAAQKICFATPTTDDQIKLLKNQKLNALTKPTNPTKVAVNTLVEKRLKSSSRYSEINKPKLTRAEKSEKFHADNAIKHNIDKYGAGLSDSPIAVEHINHFADLDNDDLVKQGKTYLSSRNRAANEDLINAHKSYKESFAHFENTTRPKALQSIHKLKQEIKANNEEIELLQHKMTKSQTAADRAQLQTQISALKSKNSINATNIQKSLNILQNDINNIQANSKNRHAAILTHYKIKDQQFLNQVNQLLKPTNRKMVLSEKQKVLTPKTRPVSIQQEEPVDEQFIPQLPIPVMAQSPILETSITRTQEALAKERAKKAPSKASIKYHQDELSYLNKAARYKEKYL